MGVMWNSGGPTGRARELNIAHIRYKPLEFCCSQESLNRLRFTTMSLPFDGVLSALVLLVPLLHHQAGSHPGNQHQHRRWVPFQALTGTYTHSSVQLSGSVMSIWGGGGQQEEEGRSVQGGNKCCAIMVL